MNSWFSLIFSERELTFTFAICYRPSVCLSVCLSSVTFVHSTQPVEIFGNFSSPSGTLPSFIDIHWQFYGYCSRGTPPSGDLNARGVVKYNNFSKHELTFTFAICCRRSVCLSVCNVGAPYSAHWNFQQFSSPFGTLAIHWHPRKILWSSSWGNPSRVAKYSDFSTLECCISETVQDRR